MISKVSRGLGRDAGKIPVLGEPVAGVAVAGDVLGPLHAGAFADGVAVGVEGVDLPAADSAFLDSVEFDMLSQARLSARARCRLAKGCRDLGDR
jgi:hypothetical protein